MTVDLPLDITCRTCRYVWRAVVTCDVLPIGPVAPDNIQCVNCGFYCGDVNPEGGSLTAKEPHV